MPVLSIFSYNKPENDLARSRFELDLKMQLAIYFLDGKIDYYFVKRIDDNTWCRRWYTEEAANEFYQYFQTLFSKYGGKLHYVKIENITGE